MFVRNGGHLHRSAPRYLATRATGVTLLHKHTLYAHDTINNTVNKEVAAFTAGQFSLTHLRLVVRGEADAGVRLGRMDAGAGAFASFGRAV